MSIQHNRVASEAGFSIDSGELRHGVFREEMTDNNPNMAIDEVQEINGSLPNGKLNHHAYVNS